MFSGFLYILHKNAYMQTNPVFPSINEASELIVAPEDLLPASCAFEVYIHVFYYYLVRQLLLYNNILDLSTFICSFIHAFSTPFPVAFRQLSGFLFWPFSAAFSGLFPAFSNCPFRLLSGCLFSPLSSFFQLPFPVAFQLPFPTLSECLFRPLSSSVLPCFSKKQLKAV